MPSHPRPDCVSYLPCHGDKAANLTGPGKTLQIYSAPSLSRRALLSRHLYRSSLAVLLKFIFLKFRAPFTTFGQISNQEKYGKGQGIIFVTIDQTMYEHIKIFSSRKDHV